METLTIVSVAFGNVDVGCTVCERRYATKIMQAAGHSAFSIL